MSKKKSSAPTANERYKTWSDKMKKNNIRQMKVMVHDDDREQVRKYVTKKLGRHL